MHKVIDTLSVSSFSTCLNRMNLGRYCTVHLLSISKRVSNQWIHRSSVAIDETLSITCYNPFRQS